MLPLMGFCNTHRPMWTLEEQQHIGQGRHELSVQRKYNLSRSLIYQKDLIEKKIPTLP